jgi:tripartite-type tricarboxylate transporter receptor subunit TctC
MHIARRRFLHLAAGAAALPAGSRLARADIYPSRPVHFVVPQAAASASDIIARLMGDWLSSHLGQQFVVDDRPGVGGNIATEFVVRSAPDGYTLLLCNSQNAISPSLYHNLSFDFIRDTAPVAQVEAVPLVMEVHPSVPAKTVPEFIAYAKANPGKINMASAGVGGPQHLAGELFKAMAHVDLVHVPYRGSPPAITDLLAGQVQVMFDVTPTALPQIRASKLRALGVTSSQRIDSLPDVPPIADFLPGYEAAGWIGVAAPKGTPPEIIDTLSKQLIAAVADDKIQARFRELGAIPKSRPPAEFAKFIAAETAKWAKVIKDAGIKAD